MLSSAPSPCPPSSLPTEPPCPGVRGPPCSSLAPHPSPRSEAGWRWSRRRDPSRAGSPGHRGVGLELSPPGSQEVPPPPEQDFDPVAGEEPGVPGSARQGRDLASIKRRGAVTVSARVRRGLERGTQPGTPLLSPAPLQGGDGEDAATLPRSAPRLFPQHHLRLLQPPKVRGNAWAPGTPPLGQLPALSRVGELETKRRGSLPAGTSAASPPPGDRPYRQEPDLSWAAEPCATSSSSAPCPAWPDPAAGTPGMCQEHPGVQRDDPAAVASGQPQGVPRPQAGPPSPGVLRGTAQPAAGSWGKHPAHGGGGQPPALLPAPPTPRSGQPRGWWLCADPSASLRCPVTLIAPVASAQLHPRCPNQLKGGGSDGSVSSREGTGD